MIRIGDLVHEKRERYGGQHSDLLRDAILRSIRRVVVDLRSPRVGIPIPDVDWDSAEDAVIDVDDKYYWVFADGIDHYLAQEGQWGMATRSEAVSYYSSVLAAAHTMYNASIERSTRAGRRQ